MSEDNRSEQVIRELLVAFPHEIIFYDQLKEGIHWACEIPEMYYPEQFYEVNHLSLARCQGHDERYKVSKARASHVIKNTHKYGILVLSRLEEIHDEVDCPECLHAPGPEQVLLVEVRPDH